MAARACACALALLCLYAASATRECLEPLELTIAQHRILNETFNGTWSLSNESRRDEASYGVLRLWDEFPKVIVPANGTTEQCRRDSRLFLDRLDKLELWALKSKSSFVFICIVLCQ